MLPFEGNAEAGMKSGERGEARTDHRRPVITLLDRNELVASRLSPGIPVIADETDRAVDRVRPPEREIDVIEIPRCALGQFRGEPDSRLRAEVEIGGGVGKLAHLPGRCLDDAVVAVAGVDAPQSRETVEELPARCVGHGRSLRRFQHAHAERLMAAI